MANTSKTSKVISQFSGQVTGLVIQFILGITLTTLIHYNPEKHSAVQTVFLTAHIIVAVAIFFGAISCMVTAKRLGMLRGLTGFGLLAVLGALTSGSIATGGRSSVAVFMMALFFVTAILIYGYGVVHLSKAGSSD